MGIECVISDFDGTVTDVDKETEPYVAGFKQSISGHIGMSLEDLEHLWNDTLRSVLENPTQNGWKIDGRIVAPAYADPYLLCLAIAQMRHSYKRSHKQGLMI